jgi:hypothetical protein
MPCCVGFFFFFCNLWPPSSKLMSTLKKAVAGYLNISMHLQTTWCNNLDDCNLHIHHCENLKLQNIPFKNVTFRLITVPWKQVTSITWATCIGIVPIHADDVSRFIISITTCGLVLIVTAVIFILHALFHVDSFWTRINNAHAKSFALRSQLRGSLGRCKAMCNFILCRSNKLWLPRFVRIL